MRRPFGCTQARMDGNMTQHVCRRRRQCRISVLELPFPAKSRWQSFELQMLTEPARSDPSLGNFTFISKEILNMKTHYAASSTCSFRWGTMCVLKPRHLWKGTSIFNVSFISCAGVPGEAGQFFIFCYLGFCTLTKAAFTFPILTLLCTCFEQSSSHLSPIHQRASPLTITPIVFAWLSHRYSHRRRFVTLCKCPGSSRQFRDIR